MSAIVLGVSGGVAAYKAALLLRAFTEAGHDVRVVPTPGALHFVGAATFEALSGNPVTTDVWSDVPEVAHVRIGQNADLVVVAPATADLLARAAAGPRRRPAHRHAADRALPGRLRARDAHRDVAAPGHAGQRRHAAPPRRRRAPARGRPAHRPRLRARAGCPSRPTSPRWPPSCSPHGAAALAPDLAGRRVVISAGGTREPLDPVRYLGNRSSGKQGWALARVAAARGAEVVLVAANVDLPAPFGVRVVPVGTAEELRTAMLRRGRRTPTSS